MGSGIIYTPSDCNCACARCHCAMPKSLGCYQKMPLEQALTLERRIRHNVEQLSLARKEIERQQAEQAQIQGSVREWLISHYLSNDVLFAAMVKEDLFKAHPELTDEDNPQRREIDKVSSIAYFRRLEKDNFTPPSGPPTVESIVTRCLPLLNQDVIKIMVAGIERGVPLDNYDLMYDLWADSFAIALNFIPGGKNKDYWHLYKPERGLNRLEQLYHRWKWMYETCGPKDKQLLTEYVIKFLGVEQDYLTRTYLEAVKEMEDPMKRVQRYIPNVLIVAP